MLFLLIKLAYAYLNDELNKNIWFDRIEVVFVNRF